MHLGVQDPLVSACNPLQFNLVGQSHTLLLKIGQSIKNVQDKQHLEGILNQPPTSTVSQALNAASNLLVVPAFTLFVADTFRPLLIDLCARWLEHDELDTLDRFSALCLLAEPYQEIFPILLAYLRRESLANGPLAFTTQPGIALSGVPATHLQRILLAYYRLLMADSDTPTRLGWSASLLQSIYRPASTAHPDGAVRWLALRCLGLQTRLPETTRERLEVEFVGSYATTPFDLCIGQELYSDPLTDSEVLKIKDVLVDAWIFPAADLRRVQAKREELATQSGHRFFQPPNSIVRVTQDDLSARVTNVAGILLYTDFLTFDRQGSTEYVPTATTTISLRALALYVSQRVPILLTATPASGKMTLIRELASRIHPEGERGLVILQLADTALDAKSLIGSYVSAAVTERSTGGFEWQDGALPRALRAGKWLVLADVDRASPEVLATLLPLVESMRLGKFIGELPSMDLGGGRGRIEGSQNFMIFGMRSVTKVDVEKPRPYALPTFFGHRHWFEVQLTPPSADELITIVERRFTKLGPAVSRAAVEFWSEMCIVAKGLVKGRDVGMRDLDKFCSRLEKSLPLPALEHPTHSFVHLFPNHLVQQEILLEARDVFFAAYEVGTPHFVSIAARAAQALGLDEERAEWVLAKRTPEYQIRKSGEISVGRARLQPKHLPSSATSSKPFALHRPALTLLESLAASIDTCESILLVGETGTGKTTAVQHAAQLSGTPLVVLNLSNQSEASDLLGGFRPVDARVPGGRLQETFVELFGTSFSRKKNQAFEDAVRAAYVGRKWARTVKLWREAGKMAGVESSRGTGEGEGGAEGPRKRRKVSPEWEAFMHSVDEFDASYVRGQSKFVFSFVEGPLVTALRNGHWVLLDEVNLASAEMLECVSSIVQGPRGSVTLTEAGHLDPIPRHPDFRLFACMNPATDAGKKDLPSNIRSRFTEFFVPPPDADEDALRSMVAQYIIHCALSDKSAISDAADFYIAAKRLTATRQLADGQNHVPHFSMRTLARALTFASDLTPTLGLRRALWEGVTMAFMMTLDAKSARILRAAAERHILRDIKNLPALLGRSVPPPEKDASDKYIQIGPFWLLRGPEPVQSADEYILTPSVEAKLVDLARIVTTRRFPVLIEGPTSSGKTSSVEYLAKQTGHRFVRINNHEHTDLQEYLGSYLTDPATGKLKFQDGILVRALRAGDWIVLDELNLAPTDVLEALNRLLDDNRELVVPETNEVIHPHPNFMLFATQNPPGLYAGRKILSRAFRNRFLEVHFDDVPQAELETILCRRCGIAESHGRKIVAVFQELQKRRQVGRVFETKNSFATLRDLFRWANRHSEGYVEDTVGGNYQHLAEQGFMLLAERARRSDDRAVVKSVIEDVMKVKIDERALYELTSVSAQQRIGLSVPPASGVVWTGAMRRLFTLVATALRYNEPLLLIGETGSGKTSVCELVAFAMGRTLHTLSCHQNTETADLLGSQRPVRNRTVLRDATLLEASRLLQEAGSSLPDATAGDFDQTVRLIEHTLKTCSPEYKTPLHNVLLALRRSMALFEWHDGPLIQAMQEGGIFLLDEISLADDSVLERLNSVLEPSRSVVLAEKGGDDISHLTVVAAPEFELIATMNPGGDYGKKELSPALRNRFTEIWVPHVEEREDLAQIIHHSWKDERLSPYTPKLLDFAEYVSWLLKDKNILGLRDLLAWVSFSNFCTSSTKLSLDLVFHHAARLSVLDGIATFGPVASLPLHDIEKITQRMKQKLEELVPLSPESLLTLEMLEIAVLDTRIWVGSFSVELGNLPLRNNGFSLQAPTTRMNAARVVRALQIPKPLLLEGSPGVGKTSLIVALAAMSGHALCRINLSDQTDLIDLFGSDMPVEGGNPGEFAWRDAAFLRAMQNGDWVLLDEMNLAPQAVLEGLNAVLDHRGTVFIPELGREFVKHPNFRVFAAQNPLGQGGGRKGLPKSFVNRFTKVYVEALSKDDLQVICSLVDPDIENEDLLQMLSFNERLCEEVVSRARFGREGSPWEFNLRDILRWMSLWKSSGLPSLRSPAEYLGDAYLARFRTRADQSSANSLYATAASLPTSFQKVVSVGLEQVQFGHTLSDRKTCPVAVPSLALLHDQAPDLEVASKCIERGWLLILNGPSYSGKTSLIRTLAALQGQALREICMNSGTDTTDLLGGFEHSNRELKLAQLALRLKAHVDRTFSMTGVLNDNLDALARALTRASTSTANFPVDLLRAIREVLVDASELESIDIVAQLDSFLQAAPLSSGHFEWVDGPLIQAMKEGSWIVLDHCNLCSPAVLDRLNSLCETGGVLVLSERGTIDGEIPVIVPHPNFRLYMLLNPRYGELSRAMRNRGVEISISQIQHQTDIARIRQAARLPKASREEQDMMNGDSATAQLCRRGLIESGFPSAHSTFTALPNLALATSDCKAFGAMSVLGLLDSLPATNESSYHWASALLFLITSMPQESLHALPRYLQAFGHLLSPDVWVVFVKHAASELCNSLRVRIGNQRGVSSRFLLSQPVLLHLNTNIVSPAFVPEAYTESIITEHSWEAIVRAHLTPPLYPLTSAPTSTHLSIMVKSRLIWGGAGAGITAPRCVRSIAPLVSSLHAASMLALTSSEGLESQHTINSIQQLRDYAEVLRTISDTPFVDFSAIRTITQLVAATFNEPHFPQGYFKDAMAITYDLLQDTAIRSGQAMLQLWSTMQLPALAKANQSSLSRLFDCLNQSSGNHQDARREGIDVAAILHLKESDELVECVRRLSSIGNNGASNPRFSKINHQEICVSTLDILSDVLLGASPTKINELFLDVLCCVPRAELRSYEFLRILMWEADVSKPTRIQTTSSLTLDATVLSSNGRATQSRFGALTRWMQTCWSSLDDRETASGPQSILGSVEHPACLKRCDASLIQLGQYLEHEEALRAQGVHLKLQAYLAGNQRLISLAVMWIHSISLVFAAFSETTLEERARVLDIQARLSQNRDRGSACVAMAEMIELLEGCSVSLLAEVAQKHLSKLRNTAHPFQMDDSALATVLGQAWINAAYMLLELYFPDIPMDPLGGQTSQSLVWRLRAEWLQTHMRTLSLGQDLVQGANYGPVLSRLRDQLSAAQSQYNSLKPAIVRGPEHLRQLTEMFTESQAFLTQAVGIQRVSHLVQAIKAEPHANVFSQEEMVQGTIATFLHRLHNSYSDLADIIAPLDYALQQLKLGLRLCTSAAQRPTGNHGTVSHVAQLLLDKPSIRGCYELLDFDLATLVSTVPLAASSAEWIVAKVSALLLSQEVERAPCLELSHLIELYDQFLYLWLTQKAREARAEEEGKSLYRSSKTEDAGSSEEAELEKEFNDLFPSYDDALDESSAAPVHRSDVVRSATSLGGADVRAIDQLHAAWATLSSGKHPVSLSLGEAYSQGSATIFAHIVRDYEPLLDASVDAAGLPQRINVLQSSLHRLAPRMTLSFDFYHDPSILELGRAARLLDTLRSRLDSLIAEWPDQMVLRHLYERAQMISQLRLDTPLAKVLSALEQLLLHTNDWETYANKENTLRVQQKELTDLIVDWRRLELKCWSTLLDREMVACVESVSVWWPQLYESVVNVVASTAGDPEKLVDHLRQLVPLLDSYLTQSPLGQFEPRLSLLRSFTRLTRSLSANAGPLSPFGRVSDILDTLSLQYLETLPSVQNSLAKQRAAVDKEIGDFIKLASWKDTNVHALKQSAQKTHRVLHKCIRKFRAIVRQPVSEVLVPQPSSDISTGDETHENTSPSMSTTSLIIRREASPSSPLRNVNIQLALQKYRSHATNLGHQLVRIEGTDAIHDLATRIAVESKELAETSIPNSEARERHIKALISRKRRAWSDLLKELRRLGLSVAVTPEILSQQDDRAGLLSLSLDTDADSAFSAGVATVNRQYIKLLEVMPDMRTSFRQHHSDISTRDFRRATSFVESSFSIAIESRKTLRASLTAYNRVSARLGRMEDIRDQMIAGGSILGVGADFHRSAQSTRAIVGQVKYTLDELANEVSSFEKVTGGSSVSPTLKEMLRRGADRGEEILAAIVGVEKRCSLLSTPIWTQVETSMLDQARNFVSDIKSAFQDLLLDPTIPVRLFQPVHAWLKSVEAPNYPSSVPHSIGEMPPSADETISKLLVSMQEIAASQKASSSGLPDEIPDKAIRIAAQHVQKVASVIALEEIDQLVAVLTDNMAYMDEDQIAYSVDRLVPFLQSYLGLAHQSISQTIIWMGSISRLTYILASTVRTLMQKGFCKPPDIQDEPESSKGGQELSEGTGMGEGAGAENISNQIEDEAQVEGLQGEEESKEKGDKQEGDNEAIEMSEDFAGEMEDVSDGEDDDEDSKSGSEADPEERIDDLDSKDPGVVDEKLWNEESAEDKPQGQDQASDNSTTQPGEKSETAAKEDKPQKSADRKDDVEPSVDDLSLDSEAGSVEDEQQGMEEEVDQAPEDGRKMDDFVPEASTLDLPDDLDLAPNDETTEVGEDEDGEGVDDDEDVAMEDGASADGREKSQEPESAEENTDAMEIGEPDTADKDDVPEDEDEQRRADVGASLQKAGAGNQDDANASENGEQAGQQAGGAQNEGRDGGGEEKGSNLEQARAPEIDHENAAGESEAQESAEGGSGTTTRANGASHQQEEQSSGQVLPNPLRSLGDASKEIQRRVDQILDRQDVPKSVEQPIADENPTEVEYTQDDDADLDMQALGPSNESDEAAKLRDLRINDVGAPASEETANDMDMQLDPTSASTNQPETKQSEARTSSLEAVLTAEDILQTQYQREQGLIIEMSNVDSNPKVHDELVDATPPIDSDKLEAVVAEWQAQGHPVEGAEEIWRLYESLTQDLSHALCEQLRLILAPTRATRLRGDFRTGKRLNMKKLVPYVASDFTRDKIWLRRTRPAAREYQVLLAVDDSRSMARASHTIHLTRQALALVARALEKLEVGELALARFGREVEVVHEFGAGVLHGGAALGRFTFDQPATDVLRLLESSLQVLRDARERGSGTSDLWQLEIIISDGICQDHERLRTVLRRAEEERVMVVFVVVDAPAQNGPEDNSIVSMLQPTIRTVDGRMDIQMERYLDSFPFRYFVVLRDVEALPAVLAGTLRQFFERISED